VIGGASGAAAGAAIAKDNRLAGALIGGLLGAGGGYVIGANVDKHKDKDETAAKKDAETSAANAKANPATTADVKNAHTADVNSDGFVTLDEVVAMENAGLSNKEMITRLQRTQQYFQLTSDQEKYLHDNGVDQKVIDAMRDMHPQDAQTASTKTDTNVDMRTDPGH